MYFRLQSEEGTVTEEAMICFSVTEKEARAFISEEYSYLCYICNSYSQKFQHVACCFVCCSSGNDK